MDTQSCKICIIEDNTPIRKLFSTILKKSGFDTIDFSDGKPALEWLENNKAEAVITDILLPDLSGTEILSIIRSKPDGNHVPMIAVTGFAKSNDREQFLNIGFDSYISKPINAATFADDVRKVISDKQTA